MEGERVTCGGCNMVLTLKGPGFTVRFLVRYVLKGRRYSTEACSRCIRNVLEDLTGLGEVTVTREQS